MGNDDAMTAQQLLMSMVDIHLLFRIQLLDYRHLKKTDDS